VLFQCKSRPRPRTSRHPRSPVPLFLFFGDGRHIFMTRRSERFKFNPDPIRINLRELILSGICWCGGTCTPPLELFPTGLAKSVSPDPVGRVKAKHQREGAACVAAPRTPPELPRRGGSARRFYRDQGSGAGAVRISGIIVRMMMKSRLIQMCRKCHGWIKKYTRCSKLK
jgi:hypothetical protein